MQRPVSRVFARAALGGTFTHQLPVLRSAQDGSKAFTRTTPTPRVWRKVSEMCGCLSSSRSLYLLTLLLSVPFLESLASLSRLWLTSACVGHLAEHGITLQIANSTCRIEVLAMNWRCVNSPFLYFTCFSLLGLQLLCVSVIRQHSGWSKSV